MNWELMMGIKAEASVLRKGCLATAAALIVATAGAASAETLEGAVDAAVRTNPEITEVATDRRAVDQEKRQARGLFYPSVDALANWGFQRTKSPSTGGGYASEWPWLGSLTLTQMLYDGGAARSELERQSARVDSAAARVLEASEVIGLQAVEAYLDVQRQRELEKLAQGLVTVHERTLRQMEQRAQSGRGRAADVQQAGARLGLARATLASTRGALADAVANYIRVVGDTPDTLDPAPRPDYPMPSNLSQALADGVDRNPTLKISAADVQVAEAEHRAADAPFRPRLDLELNSTFARDQNGVSGDNNQMSALLVARWNLYRGGIDQAAKQEALERVSESRAVMAKNQRRIQEDIRLSWNAVETARARLAAEREHAERQEQVRDAYQRQFDIAARTLLDVLDAENELFNAQSNVTTLAYTELFGMYRVLASMGKLLETLAVDPPSEAM